jgi:hypothetical protein
VNIICNDRVVLEGKELDIYLPDHKLAIEINGAYWHSEQFGKDRNYHLNKTIGCTAKDIQLLHIFDVEWNNSAKKEIWKSMIASRLYFTKKIHARKCNLLPVQTDVAREFCELNHLQGFAGGGQKLGLFYNNQLVQLIIVGESRFNKSSQFELIRAVSAQGYTIVGGLSRLLSKIPGSLISYADRRYSNGNSYRKVGFSESTPATPNYSYFINGNLESRMKYQKHKLAKILKSFDNTLSECYNMKMNNIYKLWDCGNYIFTRYNKVEK